MTIESVSQWIRLCSAARSPSIYRFCLIIELMQVLVSKGGERKQHFKKHFGQLKNISLGDTVTFTDVDGNVFTYRVSDVENLSGTAVEEMEAGEWDLTLFTCTNGGRTRVTVRCTFVP